LRIAYAASTGGESVAGDTKAREMLSTFHSIGVRESSLSDEIKLFDNFKAPSVVLDPSLLIKDYNEVISYSRVPKNDFILTYVVGSGETLDGFNNYIKTLKSKTDLPVVHIGSKGISSSDIEILDINPSDWVGFFKSAAFIITNSFHGTAFSINFEKQFIFVPHCQKPLNQRQETLLKAVGLESREADVIGEFDSIDSLEKINYSLVSPKLSAIVEVSKDFLFRSMGK